MILIVRTGDRLDAQGTSFVVNVNEQAALREWREDFGDPSGVAFDVYAVIPTARGVILELAEKLPQL